MNTRKMLISVLVVIFLLVGATGVVYSGTMMGHGMETMVGCPLMGNTAAVCNMNLLEHLNAWQNLFAAIPAQSAVMLLLLLLTLFLVFRLKQYLWILRQSPQFVYISYEPEAITHDSLRRFIARGLMHPKIF